MENWSIENSVELWQPCKLQTKIYMEVVVIYTNQPYFYSLCDIFNEATE